MQSVVGLFVSPSVAKFLWRKLLLYFLTLSVLEPDLYLIIYANRLDPGKLLSDLEAGLWSNLFAT